MISALKNLSTLADDVTKQRCLVAFANLSCEVSIQVIDIAINFALPQTLTDHKDFDLI
jgi:hypothetical protein